MVTAKTTKKESASPKKAPLRVRSASSKTTSVSTSTSSKKRMTVADLKKKVTDPKNRRSLLLALGIIVLAVVIYVAKGLFIAATVNGQPISRLTIIKDLEAQSGRVTLDSAITRALVFQEAAKKKIDVTQKDIDAEIAKISKQFTTQGQNLDQLLAAQGLTREKFEGEVRIQILVTKILGDQAKVTDKEFNDFMAKNEDLIKDEKDQNAAKATLRQQMEQQKLAQKYQEWIANVKKNAKVNYFVNY